MTEAYCTRCSAHREARAGHCPEGHRVSIEAPGYVGRHRARVAVPRMQVLEVLGFSEQQAVGSRSRSANPIPSTPRRSSRPVGRHRQASAGPQRSERLPALALSTVDTAPTENTGVLVERLWEATSETLSDVEEWHRPLETSDSDPGRRWWPWLIAGVSIALAVLAVWAVPNAVRERDAAGAASIETEVATAAAELSVAATVAAVVLDPGTDPAALSGVSVDLTRIDTAARSLLDEAAAAEELGLEYADQLGQAGELALVLERRLSVVVTYRLLVESSLQLPELPAVLGSDELGDQARILSEALTSIRDDMNSLPSDPLLDTHRLTVQEAMASLEATQSEYLAALRDGNEASADRLRGQMLTTVDSVHSELDALLGTLQPWVDETIEGIKGNLPD